MSTGSKERSGRRINPGVIAVGGVFGVVYLVLGLAKGEAVAGLIGLGIMAAFVAVFVVGARYSDTVALIGDDVNDERHVHIHQRSALITVNVLGIALAIGAIADFAQGGNGMPYIWLAAVTLVTYFGVVLVLSRRS